ncbi:PilW family protein [Candidatus Omnitrophota bacterium]
MKTRGLTLLEIIISMVILALVMTGLANIFISSKGYILRSRRRMAGGELGRFFVDPLQMDVRQDLWNQTCLGGNNPSCPSEAVINNVNYTANYNITPVDSLELHRVIVDINWSEPQQ